MSLLYRALTSVTVEKHLLKIGKPVHDTAVSMLYKQYHCYLPDCYDHPEYLSDILKQVFGNAHNVIVQDIKKELGEFSNYGKIGRFLEVISR